MAPLIPAQQAANVASALKEAFPEGISENELSKVFFKFDELCKANNGHPFALLPALNTVTTDNGTAAVIFHAAWFRGKGTPDAFAAVIFEKATGKLVLTHDFDTDWPQWLDTDMRSLTARIIEAEGGNVFVQTRQ